MEEVITETLERKGKISVNHHPAAHEYGETFVAFFGTLPCEFFHLWLLLGIGIDEYLIEESGVEPKYLLWTLMYFELYLRSQEVDVTETATNAVHSLEEEGREIEEEVVGKMIEIQIALRDFTGSVVAQLLVRHDDDDDSFLFQLRAKERCWQAIAVCADCSLG